ncbi:class I SAM-dependent rRNA methyltransferase [Pseudofulvibacter geojedonensis]|uniref:Class I SAM-dependent rRNA methyltransferase n=1 Tax=Pseudofulvibacter geojedonensis TaxID=1123758 RepID=A0ABW3HXW7_9FLAO
MNILPEITTKTIAFKLRAKAERMIKKKHPWVFEDSIVKQSIDGNAGDVAVIYDHKKNKFLACGLYDPFSPIKIKMLHFGKATKIDSFFFKSKIQKAFEKRAELLKTDTNSYRLIYGEADGMPSFIADVYNNVLVIKLYSAIWFPYLNDLLTVLVEITSCKTVVLRLSRNVAKLKNNFGLKDGQVIYGKLDNNVVEFMEHGIHFSANVIYGHKTGYFLDHRENRRRVGSLSKHKTVLDVFSYAGGFSVHALANGAKEVTSLDISSQALKVAEQNAKLNKFSGVHKTIAADAFKGLQELINQKNKFDIVIIDPPSFAKSAKEIERAKHSYERLANLGCKLVNDNGILVLASCSSRIVADDFFAICESSLQNNSIQYKILDTTLHDLDHPVILSFPEGAYLKCRYYQFN